MYLYTYIQFFFGGGIFLYMGPIGPIWGPRGPIWGPMGSMGQCRWAKADGPGPMGLEDPPVGVFQGPRPMGLKDPPMGVYLRA